MRLVKDERDGYARKYSFYTILSGAKRLRSIVYIKIGL